GVRNGWAATGWYVVRLAACARTDAPRRLSRTVSVITAVAATTARASSRITVKPLMTDTAPVPPGHRLVPIATNAPNAPRLAPRVHAQRRRRCSRYMTAMTRGSVSGSAPCSPDAGGTSAGPLGRISPRHHRDNPLHRHTAQRASRHQVGVDTRRSG